MRALVVPVLLIAMGGALGAGALVADEPPPAQAPVAAESAQTPVLSARRIPEMLLRPGADNRLRLGLQPLLDQSPPQRCLVVREEGRLILEEQPDSPLVPASNQKLVLAHAVLSEIGPDATYTTTVGAAAPHSDGVIEGDLWLVGGGDPVLSTDDFLEGFEQERAETDFEALADAIVAAGVTTVTGGVVGDSSRYDDQRSVEGWLPRDYGTHAPGPIEALSVNRGFEAYATDPDEVRAPDPAADATVAAAQRLSDLLASRGVDVQGASRRGTAPSDLAEVAVVESPPMHEIVADMVAESDNTVAEMLVKELGVRAGEGGSTASGLEVMRRVLEGAGIGTGVELHDGSGLHPANRLTCSAIVNLLDLNGPHSYLATSLAVAGESGTLRDRFEGTRVEGRLRAKTGSLDEATALSGFVTTATGDELTFSYLANADLIGEEQGAEWQDLLASVLILYPEGPPLEQIGP